MSAPFLVSVSCRKLHHFRSHYFYFSTKISIHTDEVNKADCCGKTYAKFTDVATETKTAYQQLKCYKWWCPTCGGIDGEIHKKKYQSVIDRLNIDDYFIRQLVFTVPDSLRDRFKSKDMINKLFGVIQRLIEREFGDYAGDKRNGKGRFKERKYQLNKPVVSYLHLDGHGKDTFNPHINVHVFERHGANHKIPKKKLRRIAKSYRKALIHLLREEVQELNFHYSFKVGSGKVKQAIRYMSKPIDKEMINHIDMNLKKLLCLDIKGLRFIRFWGKASNSEYRKEKGQRMKKQTSTVFEINGEAYKFVSVVSQEEFEAETAGRTLSRSSDGFIVVIDDFPNASSG